MDELRALIGLGGVPAIVLLVEITKRTFPRLEARFYPSLALFYGVAINVGLAYIFHLDYGVQTGIGLLAGIAASEAFRVGKNRELAAAKEGGIP